MSLARAIASMRLTWPRAAFPDASAAWYGAQLADLDEQEVCAAIGRLTRTSTYLPSIAEIRTEVAEAALQLPSPEDAWLAVIDGTELRAMPPEVRAAVEAVGGRYGIRSADAATVVRAQFQRDYTARRDATLRAFAGGRMPTTLPPAVGGELSGPTMNGLPETERIKPRPTMRRLIERWSGRPPGDPSEDEKRDAILVLRDGAQTENPADDPLYLEAERTFAQAGEED